MVKQGERRGSLDQQERKRRESTLPRRVLMRSCKLPSQHYLNHGKGKVYGGVTSEPT